MSRDIISSCDTRYLLIAHFKLLLINSVYFALIYVPCAYLHFTSENVPNKYVDPPYCLAEMYAGRVAAAPGEYIFTDVNVHALRLAVSLNVKV